MRVLWWGVRGLTGIVRVQARLGLRRRRWRRMTVRTRQLRRRRRRSATATAPAASAASMVTRGRRDTLRLQTVQMRGMQVMWALRWASVFVR